MVTGSLLKKAPTIVFIFSLFFCSGINSCKSDSSQNETEADKPTSPQKAKSPQAAKIPLFTPENAVEILTEYGKNNPENTVKINTRLGAIVIKLYEETPLHRANFIMLCKRGYFDKTEFYRVIPQFMIQGGGTDDLKIKAAQRAIGKYRIPAEMRPNEIFHKRGALSMAREYENNPEKESASYDFFIVIGHSVSEQSLTNLEKERGLPFTSDAKSTYLKAGGAPHLDGDHTVFGEVTEGWEVVEKIALEPTTPDDNWPLNDILISTEIIEKE